jgi:hypothetical protein
MQAVAEAHRKLPLAAVAVIHTLRNDANQRSFYIKPRADLVETPGVPLCQFLAPQFSQYLLASTKQL